jgi:hypothetical protein
MLAEIEDLPRQLKREINIDIIPVKEQLWTTEEYHWQCYSSQRDNKQRNRSRSMQVWLPMRSYGEAEKMKSTERGTHRSLAGNGGIAAANVQEEVQSPGSIAAERGGGGRVVDEDVGRRRASASARSRSTAAAMLVLYSSFRRRSAGGRGTEEGRRWCGVKR